MSARAALERDGYVVVRGVVSGEYLARVIADFERHTGARIDDSTSWRALAARHQFGFVRMYHPQSLWDVRQHPGLHHAFAAVLGTEELSVNIDGLSARPPATAVANPDETDGFIHWDRLRFTQSPTGVTSDPSKAPDVDVFVQGVLALVDTDETMGGFQCVPEIYRHLDDWVAAQPDDWDPRAPTLDGYAVEPVPLRAGDLCIWSSRLPRGAGTNTSDRLRLAQYVTMSPAANQPDRRRLQRIDAWRNRRAFEPSGPPAPYDESHLPVAHLTDHGRRLIGLDPWPPTHSEQHALSS